MSKTTEYLAPMEKASFVSGLTKEAKEALLEGRRLHQQGLLGVPVRELYRRAKDLFKVTKGLDSFRRFMGEKDEEVVKVPQAAPQAKQGRKGVQGKGRGKQG